jgi:threonine synthase
LIVEDAEILQAMATLGRQAAVFAEPAGAAAFAGLAAAVRQGMLGPEERVVVVVTGSGLKDVARALQAVPSAPVIPPTLGALRQAMEASA